MACAPPRSECGRRRIYWPAPRNRSRWRRAGTRKGWAAFSTCSPRSRRWLRLGPRRCRRAGTGCSPWPVWRTTLVRSGPLRRVPRRAQNEIESQNRIALMKWILILILIPAALAPACSGSSKGAQGPEAVPVTVAKVQKKTVPLSVRAIGNVEPIVSVTVRSQATGVLERVYFAEGEEVKKGDPLFDIDPRPFQASLAQTVAQLARDRASLQDAEATVRRYTVLV